MAHRLDAYPVLRLQRLGTIVVVQPLWDGEVAGPSLTCDLETGTLALAEHPKIDKDYAVVHGVLGMARLEAGPALAVITGAEEVRSACRKLGKTVASAGWATPGPIYPAQEAHWLAMCVHAVSLLTLNKERAMAETELCESRQRAMFCKAQLIVGFCSAGGHRAWAPRVQGYGHPGAG
jgi:hypothetical protein